MQRSAAILLSLALISSNAFAAGDNSTLSKASDLAISGSAIVVLGSLSVVAVSGTAVVESVKSVGDGLEIVVKGASNASTATIRLSGQAAHGLSLAAGTAVNVVAMSTGHMLVLSGKVIAFIPNEIGKSLLHQSRVEETER